KGQIRIFSAYPYVCILFSRQQRHIFVLYAANMQASAAGAERCVRTALPLNVHVEACLQILSRREGPFPGTCRRSTPACEIFVKKKYQTFSEHKIGPGKGPFWLLRIYSGREQ